LVERVSAVRWARPETLHVTLHFFGEIGSDRVAAAIDSVAPVVARISGFDVALGRLGAFPSRGHPRVLWLGPTHEIAALTALAVDCRAALRATGFDVESRPYRPHCTLGRPRHQWDDAARQAWESVRSEPLPVLGFGATRIVLYQSRTAPGGAVYTEHASLPFAG
jgi:2'-5' RNA ligase